MQRFSDDGTRQERTGWRDESISKRHREWGWNCPAVDLDFLMVEYNLGLPIGLIEYKHYKAAEPNIKHATYRALCALADGYRDPLPFLIAFYWPDNWAFQVLPINETAKKHFKHAEALSEYDFVYRLYRIRDYLLNEKVGRDLKRDLPPVPRLIRRPA
jgi:hypothetical protein